MISLLRFTFLALMASSLLTACGKRGHLDPPPGAEKQNAAPMSEDDQKNEAGKPKRTPIVAPKRDLLIDRILE